MELFNNYEVVDTCNLCGSINIKEYYKPGDLVMCNDCHFLFVSPRPTLREIYNSYSDKNYYDGWINESEGRLKMWHKRFKRIKGRLHSNANILDYGAGIGTFMHFAKLDGNNVFGTELSETAKRITYEQYGLKLFDSDYFFTSEYKNYFDVVTAWHVVEHVASPKSLTAKFYNILRSGGFLIVAVPNAQVRPIKKMFSEKNMETTFPKLRKGGEIHLSQFTVDTLGKLLRSIGFSIVFQGIDKHSPCQNIKTIIQYFIYSGILRITYKNYSPTIFMIAQK